MKPRIPAAQRGSRTGRILASLIAVTVVLAGCSSASEDSAAADAGWDMTAGGGDWSRADDSMANESMPEEAMPEADAIDAPARTDRSVIVTGSLYMTVEDPVTAAENAADVVQDAGGRIDGRSETAPDEYNGGSAWLVLRIPAADLDTVVDDLRELGTVDEYRTDSMDVTIEVTDLEAEISTLRASTARIETLLDDAQDISDIIKLESELGSRQAKLEGLEARQRGLNDQVSMSTIELSLTTEPVVTVKDSPDSFWDGLVSGWEGLLAFFSGALVLMGILLPWLVIAAIIVFAVLAIVRNRKARTTTPQSAPSTESAE